MKTLSLRFEFPILPLLSCVNFGKSLPPKAHFSYTVSPAPPPGSTSGYRELAVRLQHLQSLVSGAGVRVVVLGHILCRYQGAIAYI